MTEELHTENDEALAALVNLLVVLADNKWYLGLHTSEWAVGAPVLESSVACAAIAQGHMGQARVLYPLLEELPSPVHAGPPDKGGAPRRRYNVAALDQPFATWPRTVGALLIVDGAVNTLLNALRGSSYEQLGRRVGRMLSEERFHRAFADGRVRELCTFGPGQALLQAEVDSLLPEMLCWFGPADESGVRALADEGLVTGDGDTWRATYLERIGPVLADVGIDLREDTPWERWNPLQRRLT